MIKGDATGDAGLAPAMARLAGGYIAGPHWIDACLSKRRLLEPCLRLQPALAVQRQLGFDSSVKLREGLLKCVGSVESHPAGWRCWVIRPKRAELILGISRARAFSAVIDRVPNSIAAWGFVFGNICRLVQLR